jgi:hypothetical protein
LDLHLDGVLAGVLGMAGMGCHEEEQKGGGAK